MISMSTVLDKDQAIGTAQTWPLLRETALWLEWLERSGCDVAKTDWIWRPGDRASW